MAPCVASAPSVPNVRSAVVPCARPQDPVVTPQGYLYSKEAILENLLAQKKAIKKKLAAWEAAQQEAARKVTASLLA